MTCFPKEITENGIHYSLHGDYYFPDLNLPETPRQNIGHYGRMRKAYLEEHHPGLYERLILSGKLYDHLAETQATCIERMNIMISRTAQAEGVDEKLKATDQIAWVGRMNNIRQRVEEVVLEEIVLRLITDNAPSSVEQKVLKGWRFHMLLKKLTVS